MSHKRRYEPEAEPTSLDSYVSSFASLGGKARAAKLSQERRNEIARTAAQTRWVGHVKAHKHPRERGSVALLRHQARAAVKTATLSGRLTPLPCIVCGAETTQAHHTDYSKPLEVIWLCAKHHKAAHAIQRNTT